MFAENDEYEILTPDGWRDFRGIMLTENKIVFELTLQNGKMVSATAGHHFFIEGVKTKLCDIKVGDLLDVVGGNEIVVSIIEQTPTTVFDIVEVSQEKHQFIVSDCFITTNCDEFSHVMPNIAEDFWTSISPTLATGGKAIITSTPNSDEDQFATIWKESQDTFDEFGNEREDKIGRNGFYGYKSDWWEHPDRDEEWMKTEMGKIGEERFRREFGCLAHNNVITLMDDSGNIFDISIGDFYNNQ